MIRRSLRSSAINMAGWIQATAHWLPTEHPLKPQEQDYSLYKFNRFLVRLVATVWSVLTDAYTATAVTGQMIRYFRWTTLLRAAPTAPLTRYAPQVRR